MPKILTREDYLKKEYSELVKLNQKMKLISQGYYISHDGTIYLKSLVDFIEVVVQLRYPEKFNFFKGAMILPNQFFAFTKNAKKTKLTLKEEISEEDMTVKYHFGQENNPELTYTLNIVNQDVSSEETFIESRIIPQMYKRWYFEIESKDNYTLYEDREVFQSCSNDDIQDLLYPRILSIEAFGSQLTLTKHLFLDLKKDDKLSISRWGYIPIDDKNKRAIYRIKHETDLYNSHILFCNLEKM